MTTPLPEPDINTASHIHQRIIGHFTRQVAAYGAEKDAQWSALLESMTAERDDALYAGRLIVQRCDRLVAERDEVRAHIHTCGPTCAKAGCINARQNKEIEQLTETSIWQAGRISELLDAVAAQRKVLEQALVALTFIRHQLKLWEEGDEAITAIQGVLKCSAQAQ